MIGYTIEDFEKASRALEDSMRVRWVVDPPIIVTKYGMEHTSVKKRNKVKLSVVAKNTGIHLEHLRVLTKMLTKKQPARLLADDHDVIIANNANAFFPSTLAKNGVRYMGGRWQCACNSIEGTGGYSLHFSEDGIEVGAYPFASLKTLLEFLDLMVPNEE